MKKVFYLSLIISLCFSLSSCNADAYGKPADISNDIGDNLTNDEQTASDSVRGFRDLFLTEYGDLFGGMYYVRDPSFKIVLLVTDINRAHDLTKHYRSPLAHEYLDIKEVEYSYDDLLFILTDASITLTQSKILHDIGIDVINNKVDVDIKSTDFDKQVLEQALQNSQTIKDAVNINYRESLSKQHGLIPRGGTAAGGCTMSFHKNSIFGNDSVFTAGHPGCDQWYIAGGENFSLFKKSFGGGDDWAEHYSSVLNTSRADIQTSNGALTITGRTNRLLQEVGDKVCKTGKTTGTTCGIIIKVNHQPNYVPNATNTFIVAQAEDGSDLSDPGDSGSPVYSGSIAYGILSGGNENGEMIYMGLNSSLIIHVSN